MKYFYSIELGSYGPIRGEEDDFKQKKEKNLYQNEKEKKNKENEKIQPKNKISSSIDKNRFSRKNIFNLSLFAFDIDKKVSENIS